MVVPNNSVYHSTCLPKSDVSGRNSQIDQVNVNTAQSVPRSGLYADSSGSLRRKDEDIFHVGCENEM